MIKALVLGASLAVISTAAFAQTATTPMTCDDAGMKALKSEAETAKMEQRTTVDSAIGDATMAMQKGDMDACMAAMQKAKMAIGM
jgi:hypothetical protein